MINIPFNFQPTSVSVKTSSYTIPAGSYAYVVGNVRDGGTMTIDGTTCLASDNNVESSVVAVSIQSAFGTAATYSVPSGYVFEGYVYSDGTVAATGYTVGGVEATQSGLGVGNQHDLKVGGGDTISIIAPASFTYIIGYARSLPQQESNATGGFWVPTGTTINGTGAWWGTVSLFNEIS